MSRDPTTALSTLVVGLDAACLSVLDPLREDGAVPTLDSLFEEGVGDSLESQIPPWTPSAWPSIYTGTNPGKHGVFDFLAFEGYDWSVVDRTHVRERSIWEYLDDRGCTSVVVNAPVTHPPPEIDGAVLPGYLAPESPGCHPEGLLSDVEDAIGEYRVYPRDFVDRDRSVGEYCDLASMRGRAFRYLAERFDPEFGFVQFQSTDSVFHDWPGDDDAVRSVYETVDAEIEAILDSCAPDTVFVVSDHGMGEYGGHEFRVNQFLADEGHLTTRRGGDGMPTWGTVLESELRNGSDESTHERGVPERAMALLAKGGLTTQRIARLLERVGLDEAVGRVAPAGVVEAGAEQVDFENSRAYMRSRSELGVRINLADREPSGVVDPDEYEAFRERLMADLAGATTPDGGPVFDEVVPRETYFEGPHVERAADVLTIPADFDQFVSARLRGSTFGDPSQPWNHKMEGVFVACGDGVDEDATLEDAQLFDVAPTVLSSLDVPPAERMDGDPLDVVTPVTPVSYGRYRPGDRAGANDQRVTEHLTNMGYLE